MVWLGKMKRYVSSSPPRISDLGILQFRRYLRDHGFDTSTMGFMDSATSSMNEKDVSFEKV